MEYIEYAASDPRIHLVAIGWTETLVSSMTFRHVQKMLRNQPIQAMSPNPGEKMTKRAPMAVHSVILQAT